MKESPRNSAPLPVNLRIQGDQIIGDYPGYIDAPLSVATIGDHRMGPIIIRAVNSHDELLAALKEMTADYMVADQERDYIERIHKRALAAIAKAEGR